jgi:sialate O-acetylesterase
MKIISGISNGQVLQRLGKQGANARLRGECEGRGPITATVRDKRGALKGWKAREVGKVRGGKFAVELRGIPAGGPYRLELRCGRAAARIASFFVGDVWILAGQSNMEGIGLMTGKPKPHPLARAFSMRREWRLATEPLHVLAESPDRCHSEIGPCTVEEGEKRRRNAIKGVGPGLFFAREMIGRTSVPQGLVCTAHGGTSMTQWDPKRVDREGDSLYWSMLASVRATGQPVAGVLWYQGESDANTADVPDYTRRMTELVSATRRDLKQPGLPWVIVQISRVYGQTANYGPWNEIQEQQRLLPRRIKNLETVAAIDLPMDDGIHIGSDGYVVLAQRLARMAGRLAHGNPRELPPPSPKKVVQVGKPEECKIDVLFDHVVGGLRSVGPAHGFIFITPTGEPNLIVHRIVLKGNTARLHLNGPLPEGSRLTYGCGTAPICNIVDGRGHAVPMFGPMFRQPIRRNLLQFMTDWRVSEVVTNGGALADAPAPDFGKLAAQPRSYPSTGFVNEHERWFDRDGLGFFQGRIELGEPMTLRLLMGYDGPFRLWLDGEPFFADLDGVNPCVPDKAEKAVELKAGVHDIRVGLDLMRGRTWGFFLRFARRDITAKQRNSGEYAKPVYLPAE